jgi:hypothetical protein
LFLQNYNCELPNVLKNSIQTGLKYTKPPFSLINEKFQIYPMSNPQDFPSDFDATSPARQLQPGSPYSYRTSKSHHDQDILLDNIHLQSPIPDLQPSLDQALQTIQFLQEKCFHLENQTNILNKQLKTLLETSQNHSSHSESDKNLQKLISDSKILDLTIKNEILTGEIDLLTVESQEFRVLAKERLIQCEDLK